jgi:hypothetical protein
VSLANFLREEGESLIEAGQRLVARADELDAAMGVPRRAEPEAEAPPPPAEPAVPSTPPTARGDVLERHEPRAEAAHQAHRIVEGINDTEANRTRNLTDADEVPENLRYLPAAEFSDVEGATEQKTILDHMQGVAVATPEQVAAAVGLPKGRVAEHLAALHKADLLLSTGDDEYASTDPVVDVPVTRKPEPEPEAEPEEFAHVVEDQPAAVEGTKGEVTLIVAMQTAADMKLFTRQSFAEKLGLTPLKVGRWITALQERKLVTFADGIYTVSKFLDSYLISNHAALLEKSGGKAPKPVEKKGDAAERAERKARDRDLARKGADEAIERLQQADEPEQSPEDRVMEQVRAFVTKQDGAFSVNQVEAAVELPREVVLPALRKMEEQGSVVDESPAEDMLLFRYTPFGPQGAKSLADVDGPKRRNGNKAPVDGTGKGSKIKVTNKDVRQVIEAALALKEEQSVEVEHAANGHFSVEFISADDGSKKRVLIAATPRSPRSVANDRARLRRSGLRI